MLSALLKRRAILTGAAGIAAGAASLGTLAAPEVRAAMPFSEPRLLQSFCIAGFQYYAGVDLWSVLQPGTRLSLKREADNPYDARAVAVYLADAKLGFVPRNDNAAIAQLLDRSMVLSAKLVSVDRDDPWQPLLIHAFW